jgi:hypothetical protein
LESEQTIMSVQPSTLRAEVSTEIKRLDLARIVNTRSPRLGDKDYPVISRGDIILAGTLTINLLSLGLASALRDQIREDAKKDRSHIEYKASATLGELDRSIGQFGGAGVSDAAAAKFREHLAYARTLITILTGKK